MKTIRLAAALTLAALPLLAIAQAKAQNLPVAAYSNNREHRNNSHHNNTNANRSNSNTSKTGKTSTTASKPKVDLETVLAGLKLTDAQKSQVNRYQAKADADGKAAYADRSLSSDQFIAKMDKIHNDLIDSIRGILTPEQQKSFDTGMEKAK